MWSWGIHFGYFVWEWEIVGLISISKLLEDGNNRMLSLIESV